MGILGTIYGGNWKEETRTSMKAELEKELSESKVAIAYANIVRTPLQKTREDGSRYDLKNADGTTAFANSICLTLVSTVEKDDKGMPVAVGQSYLRLSRKSTLNPGDRIDPDTIEKIVVSKTGQGEREFYDAKKIEE